MDKPGNRSLSNQTFFVTCVIENREPVFRNEHYAKNFLETLQYFRREKKIELYGFVIMPDHVHFVCRVINDMTVSSLVRRIKTFTSRNQEFYWQDGFWSAVIERNKMLVEKLKYMHENPLRAKIVESIENYRWSSWHEFYGKEEPELVDAY